MTEYLSIGKRKVFFDIVLNIIATALPIAVLQLVIYPHLARELGGDEYGLMLTIYSVWIMISNSLGVVLNNVKLLRHHDYQDHSAGGDVAVLLRKWLAVGTTVVFVFLWVYVGTFTVAHIILGTVISVCILLKAYLEVGFRINLNYIAILINNVLLTSGFFVGYAIFTKTNIWEFVFLFGYVFSFLYCAYKTKLLLEKPKKTELYREVNADAYSLVVATIINNLINYADKLVLYPLMGGTAVSIYYTATVLGKITGMLTGPINSVILSYISRWDNSKSNFFFKILLLGLALLTIAYFITIIVAKPVIQFLFPQWVEEVIIILPLTTVTIMLTVLASFLQPFVLKYCNMKWQIAISGIGSGTYFVAAMILWRYLGLKGFCIGTIIGAMVKLIVMIVVYSHNSNVNSKE